MADGPDIAKLGSLLGDPARANMLSALMGGRALTASELARLAGVALSTASSHLSQLKNGGLITQSKQGRHRYFSIASRDVAASLEQFMSFSQSLGHIRYRTGPKDINLRQARVCYNHLAGEKGVQLFERLLKRKLIAFEGDKPMLTVIGRRHMVQFGVDLAELEALRRPLCRCCLDWSERSHHLAGSLGQSLLDRILALGWARRSPATRALKFTPKGESEFRALFT